MKVKDGKGDEYDAICKKPFRINSGNITLDYLGGSCPFELIRILNGGILLNQVVVFC
ncbi:Uncharacterised protein [Escherichia coli]|nr:Uncharacterised protein [Escherichia coli]